MAPPAREGHAGGRRAARERSHMSDKPSYLGLLNAIAVERGPCAPVPPGVDRQDHRPRREGRAADRGVARGRARHELRQARQRARATSCATGTTSTSPTDWRWPASDRSDLEKMEYFGQDRLDEVLGAFDNIFQDHSIDIRDRRAARALRGRGVRHGPAPAAVATNSSRRARARRPAQSTATASGELAALNDKVDALCRAVEELRQIVCAQTMPTKAS